MDITNQLGKIANYAGASAKGVSPSNPGLSNSPANPVGNTADTVSLSAEALQLLKTEQSLEPTVTPLSGGGTTLPPWPPKENNQ